MMSFEMHAWACQATRLWKQHLPLRQADSVYEDGLESVA